MKNTLILASALALAGLSTVASAADAGGQWFVRGEAGRSHVTTDISNVGSGSANDGNSKLSAIGLGVVGKKNFGADGNGFFIDGRAGVTRGKVETSIAGLGKQSDTSTKPYLGVGAGFDFSRKF